jgi:hypothetical protein
VQTLANDAMPIPVLGHANGRSELAQPSLR